MLVHGAALTAIIDLFSSGRVRTALFWLIVAAAIVVSPLYNLRAYARFETGADGRGRDRWERAVIGDHMQALGPRYHYYIVVTGYEPWVLRGIWHTEINPYLWGLQLTEVYELQLALPLPEGQPGVFILQPNRRDEQLAIIRHYHPVRIEEVRSPLGRHFADFAIVEQP